MRYFLMALFLLLVFFFLLSGCIGGEKQSDNATVIYSISHDECSGCYSGEEKPISTQKEEQKEEPSISTNSTNASENETSEPSLPAINSSANVTNSSASNASASSVETTENLTSMENKSEIQKKCIGPSNLTDINTSGNATYDSLLYQDECVSWDTVRKFYCEGDLLRTVIVNCPPGYWCRKGACEKFVGSCFDSDGNNLSTKGYVDLVVSPVASKREYDECVDDVEIHEWVCEDGNATQLTLACPSGTKCVEGKCVKSRCSETDGGNNPLTFGITKNDLEERNDACIGEKTLQEYYCAGDNIQSTLVKCEDECIDGSCKPLQEE